MNSEFHHLISQYGYWLMAFGALIEGESFLVAGGIAAQQGLLKFPGLIALALFGSMLHDGAFFYLGRFCGVKLLKKKPSLYEKSERVLKLFDRYGVWLIIGLRYAYGLRTIIPTVLGMSPISDKKFWIFDIIGGLLWSSTFIFGGYFFGKAFERVMRMITDYEYNAWVGILVVLIVTVLILLSWWAFRRFVRKN